MKISFNWLSEFVDLTGLSPHEVAHRLTMAGLEIEGVDEIGLEYVPIKVGQILEIHPHPQADKLVLCQVRFGPEPVQIVCGASNIEVDDIVPVIPAGERLPGGTKIKKGKIRGEVSSGMLCSRAELEIQGDSSGIMILPPALQVGDSLADALHLRDAILDLSVSPNRGDCLSYLGVAREVSALFSRERRFPGLLGGGDLLSDGEAGPASEWVTVEIEDPQGCPRYAAAIVSDLTVGPSPDWMTYRLTAMGLRPVNNLVDVTNYVMFETGQPLHVFDLDILRASNDGPCRILVRGARQGEQMMSIDHVLRDLEPEDVVITNGERPVAIAGVMGGVESEVHEGTRNILIECAHFKPQRIRRTSKRLGLVSESSYRFERTVDPEGVERVMQRTVELILATNAHSDRTPRVAQGMVDAYPLRWKPHPLTLGVERNNAILGISCTREEIVRHLRSIDLEVTDDGEGEIRVTPPSFRPDLEREIDLIEEVGRLYGFDRLESRLPVGELGFQHRERPGEARQTLRNPREQAEIERLREGLATCGMLESINYSFVSPGALDIMEFGDSDPRSQPFEIANPLSEEWRVLRTSLLPGLLQNVHRNLAHREESVALFEFGPIFLPDLPGGSDTGVYEEEKLAGVMCGHRPVLRLSELSSYDVFDLKAVMVDLLARFSGDVILENHLGRVPYLHPGSGAEVIVSGETVGVIGQIHPRIADFHGIDRSVYGFELSLDRLLALGRVEPRYQAFPRYPSATRDLALVVDRQTPFGEIEKAIAQFGHPLIESFTLSSIYEGDPIPEGKKSVALAVTYRSASGSLTDQKIDAVHERLAQHVCEQVAAELR